MNTYGGHACPKPYWEYGRYTCSHRVFPYSCAHCFLAIVDPHKESGQSLYRQYAGKKGKIVLRSHWIRECVRAGSLQTFHTNWAGCKVDGTEKCGIWINISGSRFSITEPLLSRIRAPVAPIAPVVPVPAPAPAPPTTARRGRQARNAQSTQAAPAPMQMQPHLGHAQHMPPPPVPPSSLVPPPTSYSYQVYPPAPHPDARAPAQMQPPTSAPPQSWQAPNGIAPQQTHLHPQPPMPPRTHYRDDTWAGGYHHHPQDPSAPAPMAVDQTQPTGYDYRYRDDQPTWLENPDNYYSQPVS